jgi:hypothetical protein
MPAATLSPCPKEPVATSTKGTLGVGWPSKIEFFNLNDISCSYVIIFDLYNAEYNIGAACPFDKTILSLIKLFGLL